MSREKDLDDDDGEQEDIFAGKRIAPPEKNYSFLLHFSQFLAPPSSIIRFYSLYNISVVCL